MSTSNLQARLRTSAVLIAVLIGLVFLDIRYSPPGKEGVWLLPALLFFSLGTAWDVTTLLRSSGRFVSRGTCLVATSMVTLSAAVPMVWPNPAGSDDAVRVLFSAGAVVVAAIAAIFFTLAVEMWYYDEGRKGAIERTLAATFVSLYVGMPMAMLVMIRQLNAGVSPAWGLAALLSIIAVTKSADAGAYFTGKSLGRRKLIPRLSPGKTVEGAVGGVIIATIVAAVCVGILIPRLSTPSEKARTTVQTNSDESQRDTGGPRFGEAVGGEPERAVAGPWWACLIIGPVLMTAGMLGDLAESLIKRDSGAKDSGDWLPGLGGVWDVSDSLLAAAMPAFVLLWLGLAGGF